MSYLFFLISSVAICQDNGIDGTELIDNTKQEPASEISKMEAPEVRAEIACMGQYLDAFYKDCGQYPKTQEGLRALSTKPKSPVCKNWGRTSGAESKPYITLMPNNLSELRYECANGKSYTLKWVGSEPGARTVGISAEEFSKSCTAGK